MRTLLRRFPKFDQILPVFAVIALFVYGRGLYVFIFKLPAWILFQTLDEIFSNLAYGLTVNLLESLFLLALLLLFAFILPASFFKDHFTVRATWLVVVNLASIIIFFQYHSSVGPDFLQYIYPWAGVTLVISILLAFLSGRLSALKKAALWFSDRVIVLLFVFIPASLISLLVLIVRNLF